MLSVTKLANSSRHPRHSKFYIRRVRGDSKDPLTQFLIQQGVPNEPCVYKPDQTTVFSFPQRAPDGLTREDVTPIAHLQLWLTYQRKFTEHKPSITVSVSENEWPKVGAWVFENFEELSGVSFLPYSEHSYRQAPYEECTEEEYLALKAKVPNIDWSEFKEITDLTEGAQTLACVGGQCEI